MMVMAGGRGERLYPLTRDELVECTALLTAVRAGRLDTLELPRHPLDILAQQIVAETAAAEPGKVILEDATLTELTYRKLFIGAELMGERLAAPCGTTPRVGVLLPNINATPVVLLALWQLGKVPAILNFSTGTATMLACAELAGLKHIITSRNFLQRAKLDPAPFAQAGVQLLYLEDLRAAITGLDRALALLGSFFNFQPSTSSFPQPVDELVGLA